MSSESDILICGFNQERFAPEIRTAFRHWQVFNVATPFAIEGRRFTTAYFTEGAEQMPGWPRVHAILQANALKTIGGRVLPFSEYVPPMPDVQDFIDAELVSSLRRSRYPHS